MENDQFAQLMDALDDLRLKLARHNENNEQLLTNIDLALRALIVAVGEKVDAVETVVHDVRTTIDDTSTNVRSVEQAQARLESKLDTVAEEQATVSSKVDVIRNRDEQRDEEQRLDK